MIKQLFALSTILLVSSNSYGDGLLQRIEAHPGLQEKLKISNQLIGQCKKKNVSSAFADFDLVQSKAGKVSCQLLKKHKTPQCPKGYLADKKICVKAVMM